MHLVHTPYVMEIWCVGMTLHCTQYFILEAKFAKLIESFDEFGLLLYSLNISVVIIWQCTMYIYIQEQ